VPHGTFKNHASGSGHAKQRGAYNKNIIIFKKFLRNKSLKEDEEKYCANTG
jgi:hypothetical protein